MSDLVIGLDDRAAVDLFIRAFQISRAIRLVADLGIADKIKTDGSCNLAELATACSVEGGQLIRVLRALAAFGIFRIDTDGLVSHSPRSLLLRIDAERSLYYSARFWTQPGSWRAWGALDIALTGGVPHQQAWGTNRFDYLRQHPEEARSFDAFMAHFPDDRHEALAGAYDFSAAKLIVDIGGGNGEALRRILARFPAARGLVFDREDVVAAIPPSERLDGRIEIDGGSFLEQAPAGGDVYILMRVLHDWSDDDCVKILRVLRAAMPRHARLLIVEQILEPDPAIGAPVQYLIDMQMMAMFGSARERTKSEFGELLGASGFNLINLIATPSAVSIIEAIQQPTDGGLGATCDSDPGPALRMGLPARLARAGRSPR